MAFLKTDWLVKEKTHCFDEIYTEWWNGEGWTMFGCGSGWKLMEVSDAFFPFLSCLSF